MKKKITFISLIIICIIMFLITNFCPIYKVEGNSMSPTLKNNDYVCIKKTKSFIDFPSCRFVRHSQERDEDENY